MSTKGGKATGPRQRAAGFIQDPMRDRVIEDIERDRVGVDVGPRGSHLLQQRLDGYDRFEAAAVAAPAQLGAARETGMPDLAG